MDTKRELQGRSDLNNRNHKETKQTKVSGAQRRKYNAASIDLPVWDGRGVVGRNGPPNWKAAGSIPRPATCQSVLEQDVEPLIVS